MSDRSHRPSPAGDDLDALDEELRALLEDARGPVDPPRSGERVDALLAGVEREIATTKRHPLRRLRERSTRGRRALALLTLGLLVLLSLASPRGDLGALAPFDIVLHMGALLFLGGVCVFVATRPLHVPELQARTLVGLGGGSVAAAVVLALFPLAPPGSTPTPLDVPFFQHAAPCLVFGSLVAVPAYAIARLVDRGSRLGPLLAAAAAGLTADAALGVHCPATSVEHTVGAHAGIALVFVMTVSIALWLKSRVRR